MYGGDDEARPPVGLPALHLQDPENAGDREQNDAHDAGAARQKPEGLGVHRSEHDASVSAGQSPTVTTAPSSRTPRAGSP